MMHFIFDASVVINAVRHQHRDVESGYSTCVHILVEPSTRGPVDCT